MNKDCKTFFYIHQNTDAHHFEKTSKVMRSKEEGGFLKKYHDGEEI